MLLIYVKRIRFHRVPITSESVTPKFMDPLQYDPEAPNRHKNCLKVNFGNFEAVQCTSINTAPNHRLYMDALLFRHYGLCLSKKSCPISFGKLLNKMGQDFLDIL